MVKETPLPRVRRGLPRTIVASVIDQVAGCPHKTAAKWFKWIVGKPKGKRIKAYPPGLPWIKGHKLAGSRRLYYMEVHVLTDDQVERIEGRWGTLVLESLLGCIATKLEPLDVPFERFPWQKVYKWLNLHQGEILPICRDAKTLLKTRNPQEALNATDKGPCQGIYRNFLRRFRAYNPKPLYTKTLTRDWGQYAGLGLTSYEVDLLKPCWARPATSEEGRLKLFIHQQLAAQLVGFQLFTTRLWRPTDPTPYPGSTMVRLGVVNRYPPKEGIPDPNVFPNGTDKPMKDWVWDWKEEYPQLSNTNLDYEGWEKKEITLPPPLILTKATASGYILRGGLEPSFKAQLGA